MFDRVLNTLVWGKTKVFLLYFSTTALNDYHFEIKLLVEFYCFYCFFPNDTKRFRNNQSVRTPRHTDNYHP